jgi:peroxiredoxin Q/BCP
MFTAHDVQIYGVSIDPAQEHARFRAELGLPFPLLADVEGEVSEAYDSLAVAHGKKYSARKIVLVDRDGKVAYRDDAYEVGNPEDFTALLDAVRAL